MNDGLFIKLRYVCTLPQYDDIFDSIVEKIPKEKRSISINGQKQEKLEGKHIYDAMNTFLLYEYSNPQGNYEGLPWVAYEKILAETDKIVTQEGKNYILFEKSNELLVKYIESVTDFKNTGVMAVIYTDLDYVLFYIRKLIEVCNLIEIYLQSFKEAKNSIISLIDSHLDDKIITYVKFRHGTEADNNQINERNLFFHISSEPITRNSDGVAEQKLPLYLLTRNDSRRYYDEKGNPISYELNGESRTIQSTPFTDLYSFGPFHKIFEGSTNETVGRNMSEVMTKLANRENVFVMGYGASGAGKTSTLIEFQAPGQREPTPGALVYMLDNLAQTHDMSNATLQITELFQGGTIEKFEAPISIIYKENMWKVELQGKYKSIDPKTIAGYEAADFLPQGATNIETGSLVSTILSQLVNKSRLSRGTVNNPQSSRSHIMIDIKFNEGPHLFVGDFAGVEQKFNFEYISRREHKLHNSIEGLLTTISAAFRMNIDALNQPFIEQLLKFESIDYYIDNDNIYKYIEFLFELAQVQDVGKLELNPEIMSLIKLKYQKSDRESFAYPYSDIIQKKKTIDKIILEPRYDFIKTKYKLPQRLYYSYHSTIQDIETHFAEFYEGKNHINQDTEKNLATYANILGMNGWVYLNVTINIKVNIDYSSGVKVIHMNTIYEIKKNKKILTKKEIKGINKNNTRGDKFTVFGENVGTYNVAKYKGKDFYVQYQYVAGLNEGKLYKIEASSGGPSGKAEHNKFRKIEIRRSEQQLYFLGLYKNYFKGKNNLINERIKQVLNLNVYDDFLTPLINEYNKLADQLTTQKNTGIQQSQKLKTSFKNISKLLYYVQYLQNEIINRTYEGVFINESLSRFRSGMANNLKLKQMQTLYTGSSSVTSVTEEEKGEGLDMKDRIYREKILSKLIPGSTDQYCGHTYGDIPLSIHFDEREIDYKTSDTIHDLIQKSIQTTTIRGGSASTELAPKPIDVNYCLMLVINNSKEANDPPRTAFIDTNNLKREFNRFFTRNSPSNKNFLFLKWEMHPNVKEEFYKHSFIQDINTYRSKTVDISILEEYEKQIKKFGFGNGITKEITTSLLDDITNIVTINSQGLKNEHDRIDVRAKLNSLILKLDFLNAPSLIGTLVFADEMSKYSLSHYTCHHIIMHDDRIKTQPYELYKILEEQISRNMALIKPLFELNATLIKKPIEIELVKTGIRHSVPFGQTNGHGATSLGGKLSKKNVSAKYKKTKRGKKLIKQSKKRKNKNT